RPWRRPDHLLPIIALMLLAGPTLWRERITRPDETTENVERTDPDFIGHNIPLVNFNAQGQPSYELLADRVRHYPVSDINDFDHPRLRHFLEDGGELNIRSEQGETRDGGENILLTGDVVIHRSPTPTDPELQLDAQTLLYWPDTQRAASDDPVKL